MVTRLILLAAMKREGDRGNILAQETLIELNRLYAIEDAVAALPRQHLSDKPEVVKGCLCPICRIHLNS